MTVADPAQTHGASDDMSALEDEPGLRVTTVQRVALGRGLVEALLEPGLGVEQDVQVRRSTVVEVDGLAVHHVVAGRCPVRLALEQEVLDDPDLRGLVRVPEGREREAQRVTLGLGGESDLHAGVAGVNRAVGDGERLVRRGEGCRAHVYTVSVLSKDYRIGSAAGWATK